MKDVILGKQALGDKESLTSNSKSKKKIFNQKPKLNLYVAVISQLKGYGF